MSLWQAVVSGILQGLTEFLPVSSSGHLVLLHHCFGYKYPQLLFDIFLHVGTLLSVLVYFRKDIIDVFLNQKKFLLLIVIGSIPTAVVGFLFESFVRGAFASIKLVGFMLLATAFFLFLGDLARRLKRPGNENSSKINAVKALAIGAMQGLAILPGFSRSGATISTALIFGVSKKEAIRFSFFMAVPAIIGALIFELINFNGTGNVLVPMQILAGAFTSFLTGLLAIYFLIKAINKNKLSLFAIYCLLLGLVVLIKTYI